MQISPFTVFSFQCATLSNFGKHHVLNYRPRNNLHASLIHAFQSILLFAYSAPPLFISLDFRSVKIWRGV
jgi:hypothetical protein